MAKNCYLKQYKKNVNNDNLPVYNTLKVKVTNSTTAAYLGFKDVPEPFEISAVGSLLINGASSVAVDAGDSWVNNLTFSGVPQDEYGELIIPNKYNILGLNGAFEFDGKLTDSFGWGDELIIQFRIFGSDKKPISLADIAQCFPKLEALSLENQATGNIRDLIPLRNTLTTITKLGSGDNKSILSGTFDDLGNLYKVNNLERLVLTTNLGGTIEGYVANRLIQQPATAGSVSVDWLGRDGLITYNGAAIEIKANNTIAWDAQGNITLS